MPLGFEKPYADASVSVAPSAPAVPSRPATSARRNTVVPDTFGAGISDMTSSENKPCSIDEEADTTIPARRIW